LIARLQINYFESHQGNFLGHAVCPSSPVFSWGKLCRQMQENIEEKLALALQDLARRQSDHLTWQKCGF
jgi:hypothetical protein